MSGNQPLAGVRVVEFSTMITASLAAMILSEQGADVVKVEPLAGDPMRRIGSQRPGLSALFQNCNKGKRSVALDLKSDADIALARRLCEGADVVISNYRPGTMERLGLSWEALSRANPKLVFARITGFGTHGPQAGSPAYDHVMQAQLGYTVAQGGASTPRHVQTAVCDKVTALMAAQAVSSALFAAERTGAGTRVDLSMLDAGLHFLFPDSLMHATILEEDAVHLPELASTYCTLAAADGHFVLAALGDAMWADVFRILGRGELVGDPRFATQMARMGDYPGLIAALQERPVPKTVSAVLAELAAADVPAARCASPMEALEDPQVVASGTVTEVEHPVLGRIRSVRPAAIFGGQPGRADLHAPALHAPALGADTDAVREAGGW